MATEESKELFRKLTDPDGDILKRLKEMAPGTYNHSVQVSELCDTVARELGLDPDLLRCAALYHDVGKLNNPKYFSENQNGENPHDKLDPQMSFEIISRHVSDGVLKLLSIENMPRRVIEIISQHHGDTLLISIFNKVKGALEDHFRYKCEKPQCPEAAILMIVDSVEATSRAKFIHGELIDGESRRILIEGIITRLQEDGQLDGMKVGHLRKIIKVLIRELDNIYHKRVKYEGSDEEPSSKEN